MGPVAALHPDDRATIDRVHRDIVALRRTLRHSDRAVARHMQIKPNSVLQWNGPRGRRNPLISNLQRHARTVGHHLTPTPVELPDLPLSVEAANLWAMSNTTTNLTVADEYGRAAILAQLVTVRRHLGHTCESVAQRIGCTFGAVWRIEAGEKDPLASTWMRYVRVLGGRLDLVLHETVTTELELQGV